MALRDWFWIILLGSIWGCSFLFNAVLIRELGPLWVSAGRVSIGALGCWAVVFVLKKKLPTDPKTYGQFFILGTLNYAIPFALFPLSQGYLASGVAAIINALTPMMTVIVGHYWINGERATMNKSVGVLIGFAGAAILAQPALAQGGHSKLWAIGACLLATGCYAFSINYVRRLYHLDATVIATLALTCASIVAVPAAFMVHGVPHLQTTEGWAALLGTGLVSTAFSFQIIFRLMPRIGGTNASLTTFIAPITALVLGITLLGEEIYASHIIGMVIIFTGLAFIDGRLIKRWIKQGA